VKQPLIGKRLTGPITDSCGKKGGTPNQPPSAKNHKYRVTPTDEVQWPAIHQSHCHVARETSAATKNNRGDKGELRFKEIQMPMIDYEKAKEMVSMDWVLNWLPWKPSSRTGSQERGPCPIHESNRPKSRSFSVDRHGGRFQCFSCKETGNQLDLFAKVRKLPLYAAAIELCRCAGVKVPYLTGEQRRGTSVLRQSKQPNNSGNTRIAMPAPSTDKRLPFKDDTEGNCKWKV